MCSAFQLGRGEGGRWAPSASLAAALTEDSWCLMLTAATVLKVRGQSWVHKAWPLMLQSV